MPIAMIRKAGAPRDDAVQSVGRALPPSGPRSEAIRRLLDALGRHVSGKEILSRDALVKLVENLARTLKYPPVPHESERAVARRLIDALKALPMPERVLAAKQIGAREPAHRAIALLDRVAGRNPNAPPPTDHRGTRNLPPQFSLPPGLAAAEEPKPRDVAPLQAMLKKTFGAEEDVEAEPDDGPLAGERGKTTGPKPQETPNATGRSTRSSGSDHLAVVGQPHDAGRSDLQEPRTISSILTAGAAEADISHEPATNAGDSPEQIPDDAGTAREADTVADASDIGDAFESDGTYAPPRARGTEGRHRVRAPITAVAERRGTLPDLARVLVQDGLDLHRITPVHEEVAAPRDGEVKGPVSNSDPTHQERQPDTLRPRTAPRSDLLPAEPPSDNPEDRAALGSTLVLRQTGSGEEPSMRQALALLVGLPREIIPAAMVPYPPCRQESDDVRDEERYPREEREEAGEEADGKGEGERRRQQPGSDGNLTEPSEEADGCDPSGKLGRPG